jgi:integrase
LTPDVPPASSSGAAVDVDATAVVRAIANRNKPTEVRTKQQVFEKWLDPAFGDVPLNEIDAAAVARFRAALVLYQKRTGASSPPLAGFVGGGDVIEGGWYAAVCLAGEAGLRSGEVKALQWEHVDLVAGTVTVAEQTCPGVTTTPKGSTRRKVPMTAALRAALEALPVVPREGYVVRNVDGSALGQVQMDETMRRIVRRAGLPSHRRTWHALRHRLRPLRRQPVDAPELGRAGKGVPKNKTAESKLV